MALNFLGRATPAVLSANRLMGVSDSVWRGGTLGSGWGNGLAKTGLVTPKDCNGDVNGDFGGGGGLNTCMGRTTVCTTSGWSLTLLVAKGVAATSEGA